ncbi:DUF2628 domain-containing protein [Hoeflea poritis]|uniref:DUF2628 domain-containing protein n=1 Tax=Hoeflea poritis TaxID=2993659 RepID=A0ABT4VMQ5_9HYPH|nr:DUF2628 domain-containing protein [Hoeflea poritis]MDA4845333.1 DUF2628 domain-containing protein [Hoeflea poritis]
MASYVVLTPPDGCEKDERAALIRDGFSLLALIVPVIWLLWNRLWFAAIMLLLLSVAIAVAISQLPAWSTVFTVSSVMISLFVALEGNNWRIAKKERQGWDLRAVIDAPDHATAEEIFFSAAAQTNQQKPRPAPAFGKEAATGPAPVGSGPALGLLDYENRG